MKSPIVTQFDEQKARGNLVAKIQKHLPYTTLHVNFLNGRRRILAKCCPVPAE